MQAFVCGLGWLFAGTGLCAPLRFRGGKGCILLPCLQWDCLSGFVQQLRARFIRLRAIRFEATLGRALVEHVRVDFGVVCVAFAVHEFDRAPVAYRGPDGAEARGHLGTFGGAEGDGLWTRVGREYGM
ncbi:MAG: hypothetical protein P1V35_11485 [Planctomycetota bacterium]|nr:hypothetical protein [Planctomycetota bacterium]